MSEQTVPAFIHIPKTGGTYLAQLEGTGEPILSPLKYLGHCAVADLSSGVPPTYPPQVGYKDKRVYDETDLAAYTVFSAVRNPYDWLVSYWEHAGGVTSRYTNTEHYDYEAATRGFDYLIRTVAERQDAWPNRRLIHFALFSYHGPLVVDWLCRNESLDDDVAALAERVGASYAKRPPQRVGARAVRDFRHYYDEDLASLVERTWGRELELFGYGFERLEAGEGILGREIAPTTKVRVAYRWEDDELTVDGIVR